MKYILRGLLELLGLAVLISVLVVLGLIAFTQNAHAAGTTGVLTWSHPTQRIDDSPLSSASIRETLIEWRRTAAGPIAGSVRVAAPASTVDVPGLICGDWIFTATTILVNGEASDATTQANPPYRTGVVCRPKGPSNVGAS